MDAVDEVPAGTTLEGAQEYRLLPVAWLSTANRLSLFTLEILHFTPDIAHWPGYSFSNLAPRGSPG